MRTLITRGCCFVFIFALAGGCDTIGTSNKEVMPTMGAVERPKDLLVLRSLEAKEHVHRSVYRDGTLTNRRRNLGKFDAGETIQLWKDVDFLLSNVPQGHYRSYREHEHSLEILRRGRKYIYVLTKGQYDHLAPAELRRLVRVISGASKAPQNLALTAEAKGRLKAVIADVKFDKCRLNEAIELLEQATGQRIFVAWRELAACGISRRTPITFRVRNRSLESTLKAVLAQASGVELAFTNEEGQLLIATRDALAPHTPKSKAKVHQRLNERVRQVSFNGSDFEDVIQFFRDVSGVAIDVAWDELSAAGVTKTTKVDLARKNILLGEAISAALEAATKDNNAKLGYNVTRGVIRVFKKDLSVITFRQSSDDGQPKDNNVKFKHNVPGGVVRVFKKDLSVIILGQKSTGGIYISLFGERTFAHEGEAGKLTAQRRVRAWREADQLIAIVPQGHYKSDSDLRLSLEVRRKGRTYVYVPVRRGTDPKQPEELLRVFSTVCATVAW